MSITERKEREKVDLYKAILNAAREIFLSKGYEQTSIRNIAEKIEYSPTTIYLYFKDKASIFHAIHAEGFLKLNMQFAVLQTVSNPLERLKAMGRIYMNFAIENPELYDLMFIQQAPMEVLEKKAEWNEGQTSFDGLKLTIQGCIDNGDMKFIDAEIGAFTIWSAMHGMCSLVIRNRCMVISENRQETIPGLAYEAFIQLLENQKK